MEVVVKPKKRNIHDDFERIYMRFNDVKRFMPHADLTIGETKDFKSVVEYIVHIYRGNERYKTFFSRNGFEAEDLRNVATVFAYTFVGRQAALGLDPRDFRLMIRYIGQRMSRLLNWTAKKFYNDEVTVTPGLETLRNPTLSDSTRNRVDRVSHLSYALWVDSESPQEISEVDRLNAMKQDLDEMKAALAGATKGLPATRKLKNEVKALASAERALRRRLASERGRQRGISEQLRSKLKTDPEKYREQLCYYATTKSVSHDVRNAARSACDKYGFDYKTWAKQKIADTELFGAEFSY